MDTYLTASLLLQHCNCVSKQGANRRLSGHPDYIPFGLFYPSNIKSSHPLLLISLFFALLVSAAAPTPAAAADPKPVLMVIANQDFYYREYAKTRHALKKLGLDVIVAAATTDTAIPHDSGYNRNVRPDLALLDVNSDDYSAIVFVGGWGAASYQYAFEGTYDNSAYRPDASVVAGVNLLINDFLAKQKPVAAVCHGVTVLAWARVNGVSPIKGRIVAAWAGGGPAYRLDGQFYPDSAVPDRWQIETNSGIMPLSASINDPLTSEDDVIVDGNIITAENYTSAPELARVLANAVIQANGKSR